MQTQQQPPETFDWAHQWYSIGSAEDMDPSRPHAITLLGRDLVLWRDQQGDWRAFEDMCPHRLAPLSGVPPSAATKQPQQVLIGCRCADISSETCALEAAEAQAPAWRSTSNLGVTRYTLRSTGWRMCDAV